MFRLTDEDVKTGFLAIAGAFVTWLGSVFLSGVKKVANMKQLEADHEDLKERFEEYKRQSEKEITRLENNIQEVRNQLYGRRIH